MESSIDLDENMDFICFEDSEQCALQCARCSRLEDKISENVVGAISLENMESGWREYPKNLPPTNGAYKVFGMIRTTEEKVITQSTASWYNTKFTSYNCYDKDITHFYLAPIVPDPE